MKRIIMIAIVVAVALIGLLREPFERWYINQQCRVVISPGASGKVNYTENAICRTSQPS